MSSRSDIINLIRKSAGNRIIYLPHAVRQMSRPNRMIRVEMSERPLREARWWRTILTMYVGSCLILGYGMDDAPIHVICSPKGDYLAIITAYIPRIQEWEEDFNKRKRP